MAGFDINKAKADGWSDAEIQAFVTQQGLQGVNRPVVTHGGAYFEDTSTPEWQEKYGPLSGLSDTQKVVVGTGRGIVHTANSAGNLVGLVPDSKLAEEAYLDRSLLADPSGRFGNLVGEAAITTPLGAGAAGAAARVGSALGTRALEAPIVNALVQGGTQGLVTSDPGQRLANTTIGAATGGTLGVANSGVNKLVNGLTQTPSARYLRAAGVENLTPGQLNPTGVANQFEQALEHVPVVGQLVQGAREAGEHSYQRAIFQQAAAPGAAPIKASSNVHDMLQQAYDSYAPLYAPAKGHAIDPGDVTALRSGLSGISAQPGTSQAGQQAAQSFVDNELTRLPAQPTSTDLLGMRSNLRQAARKARLATDSVAQDKATVYDAADQQVTDALRLNLPQHAQRALDAADSNYGNYKIVENAVAASKDNLAGLTPQKLSQAVYNATADPAYARGAGGPLRDLAQAGTETFQGVVPYNGAVMAPLLAGGVALHAAPVPTIAAGTGALGLTLTDTGRKLAAGATAPQQAAQRLTDALVGYVPGPLQAPLGAIGARGATGALMPYTPQLLPQATAALMGLVPGAAPAAAAEH